MATTFQKRSGCRSKGHDYEDLLLTQVLLKLANDNDVEDFQASSNEGGLGSLDDLVVNIKYRTKPDEQFYFQLKHKGEGNRQITRDMLAAEDGDFSLQEYFQCFQSINKNQNLCCGLYTCGIFDPDPKYISTFKLKNKSYIKIQPIKSDLSSSQDVFNTSDKNYVYEFKIYNSLNQNSLSDDQMLELCQYEQFLRHFRFYPNQEPLKKMEISTAMLFKKTYSCEKVCFDMFREFVSNWSRLEGKKNYLNKETVKFKIVESLLKPYIRIPNFSNMDTTLSVLQEACLENDLTIFEDNDKIEERILRMFGIPYNIKSDEILNTGKEFYIISEETRQIDQLEERQKYIILWHMKKLPLVIRTGDVENICDIIQFCWEENKTNRKFILIGKHVPGINKLSECKMFCSLQDLNPSSNAYKKIAAKTISVQSRNPVSVDTLIKDNEDVKEIITTNKIVEMLTTSSASNVAPTEEVLPYPYMKQFLPRMIIHLGLIGESTEENVFVLSCYKNMKKIEQVCVNGLEVISVDQFLQTKHREKTKKFEVPGRILLVKNDDITKEEFSEICEEFTSISCHHLKVLENANLEWISSNGNTDVLQKYVTQTDYIEAKYLLGNTNNKVNIVCAKSGSGKSILLKYLQLNWPSNYWTVYINFREYFTHEDHNSQDILKSILKFQSKKNKYNHFEEELRNTFVKDGRIVVFWDGLDELPISHHVVALNTIMRLSTLNNVINWITAREHLKPILEKAFKIPPLSIKEMDRSQQEDYIKDYFRSKNEDNYNSEQKDCVRDEELEAIVKKIIKIVSILHDVGFLGIPLQIAMLTELFYQNAKKYENWTESSVTFITVTDLIYHFLKERIVFYFKERGQCDITNNFIRNRIKDQKKYQFSLYELVALKTFLPSDIFANLKLDAKGSFSVFRERHDDFGIITQINDIDESVTFVHNIFGEYFVAKWMVEHLEHVSSFKQFFFEDTFKTIRMLFDTMLAKNCPLHLAVLRQDFSSVQKYEDLIDQKDKGGRNPLQLACSWGIKRPFLKTQKKNDIYEIDVSSDNSIEDDDEYKEILTFLVEKKKVDPFKNDDLFQWTSLDYADGSYNGWFSLLPLDVIIIKNYQWGNSVLKKLDVAYLLYFSVKFNYPNIFNNVDIVYVLESRHNMNLLQFSAYSKNGSWFLERILKNKKYLEEIDQPAVSRILIERIKKPHSIPSSFCVKKQEDGFCYICNISKKPPLILAALRGNEEAIRILLDKGADINVCDENQDNALFYAVKFQHKNIIKCLIEKGIHKNQTNVSKSNVLNIATVIATRQPDYCDMVYYLLEQGVFICFNKDELCPLSYATISNCKNILDILLTNGKFCDEREKHIQKSFIVAIQQNLFEMVKYFIQNGADTNAYEFNTKKTPLHLTTIIGNVNIAELLIQNKANINACDCNRNTPLHIAVQHSDIDMVKLLVAKGAELSKVDCHGLPPIWYAIKNDAIDEEEVIFCQLKLMADLIMNKEQEIVEKNITDKDLLKRLMSDGREIFKYLVENGADVNVFDQNGVSLLEHADGDNDIVQLLISKGAKKM